MGKELTSSRYWTALDYILSFADYERAPRSSIVFDLRRMAELLHRLGDPHLPARSIHIAGTKGKGSIAAMIAAVLIEANYKTGLFTSPHLHTLRERIRVNGEPITEEELATLVEKLKPEIEAVNHHGLFGQLTTFEILTALAFCYFEDKGVDFQVLETGLGGRLDATNVVKAEVCVISSISFDHTDVLGNTLAQIATEKAGIIKPGSIVVSSPKSSEAALVIERVCQEKGARLIRVGREVTWQVTMFDSSGQRFRIKGLNGDYELFIPLLGAHQLENAASAVAALEALATMGVRVSPESIAVGLAKVQWSGRLEILRTEPMLVVDGAHNAESASRLKEALQRYFSFGLLILIVGTSWDKDIPGIIAELADLPGADIIVTQSRHPRAVAPSGLKTEFSKHGLEPLVADSVVSAIDRALSIAKPRDLICITGSIFVVAEAIEYLKGISPELYPASEPS